MTSNREDKIFPGWGINNETWCKAKIEQHTLLKWQPQQEAAWPIDGCFDARSRNPFLPAAFVARSQKRVEACHG
jgi:hypothetical protein